MKPRIAYVDDNLEMHEMLRIILLKQPVEKTPDLFATSPQSPPLLENPFRLECYSGPEAVIDAVRGGIDAGDPFQMIITDLRMPAHNGDWVMQQARAADTNIRIIVLTAFGEISLPDLQTAAGGADFIFLD